MPKPLLYPFITGAMLALVLQTARSPLQAVMAQGTTTAPAKPPATALQALLPAPRSLASASRSGGRGGALR